MTLAMVERLHLLEDASPRVSGDLLDDLDGVLEVGPDVDAGLHAGVGAAAQHLAGQPIQFCGTREKKRG